MTGCLFISAISSTGLKRFNRQAYVELEGAARGIGQAELADRI